ncbi:MAG: DUF86 domain-containing protein [Clostridiales bacterium]|jgi:uncharacterized protein with HEPN domain|nr:DUF86 domain-containing protein [Clostridiales bacterium]
MRVADDKSIQEIQQNELLADSIMFRLIQIAENNEKLIKEFKDSHPDIPWRAIKGMRNTIVHNYGIVDISIVYDTVKNSVPEFYKQLKQLLVEI